MSVFDEAEKELNVFDLAENEYKQAEPPGKIALPGWLEKMSEKQKQPGFERDVLPILGDIAGGFMPTPFGKAKAATTMGKVGMGAAKTLFKSGTAAGGSALGEARAQQSFGEPLDIEKMQSQAMWGALGEGAAGIIGPILKPVIKWIGDITVGGSWVKETVRKNLIKSTADRASEFIKDVAPESVKSAATKIDIDDLGLSVTKAFDEQKVIYDAYGKHIDALAKGPEGGVILDDTQQLLGDIDIDKISDKYGFTKGSKQSVILKNMVRDEVMHPDDLKDLLATMYKKGKKSDWHNLTAGQKSARDKLKETILDDVTKASPEAALLKESGDKAWKEITRFNTVQRIYNSALREMPSGDKYLNPTMLSKNIYKGEKVIRESIPDLWPKLKREADHYREVAGNWRPPDINKMPMLGRFGTGAVGSAAGAYALGPQWIPVIESFGAISAWATLNPAARDMLGKIVKNTIVKPAVHMVPE